MKTLLISNLGGGDLMFQILDDVASKRIDTMPEDGQEFDAAIRDMSEEWHDGGVEKPEYRERVLQEFFVQSPVIENLKQPLEADRIIYLHSG